MKLPNARLAVVERQKLVDYLLNSAHPDNGGKAQFFVSLGFSSDDPGRLTAALQGVAQDGHVAEWDQSAHGKKYVVDGWLPSHTEGSRQRSVRTIWIIDQGSEAPRLVTAYPGKE